MKQWIKEAIKALVKKSVKIGIAPIIMLLLVNIAYAASPISDGFDYPLGTPDGIGYGVEGYGGLAFLEKYDYQADGYPEYHPGEDWNDDDSGRNWNGDKSDTGDPVYAVSNGIVKYAGYYSDGWGNLVLIEHKPLPGQKFVISDGSTVDSVWSLYGHLASLDSNIQGNLNQPVRRGQVLGTVGDFPHGSGKAYHLHFEIRIKYRDAGAFVYNTPTSQPWPTSEVQKYYTDPSNFISANRPKPAPLVGDWDNNNIDETGTFNPRTSKFSWVSSSMGEPGDLPIVGDWNGDGKDTIGVYRPGTAQFFLDNNNNGIIESSDQTIGFGSIGDYPIVGDWNKDGKDEIGVFRQLSNTLKTTFYLRNPDGTVNPIEFATPTDMPIVGDWNNDGQDDIGVFRRNDPSKGNKAVFYLKNGATTIKIVYGNNDDLPIAGKTQSDGMTRIGTYTTIGQFNFKPEPVTTTPPPTSASITVTSPNGGESWPYLSTRTVQWTYTGNPGTSVFVETLKGASVIPLTSAKVPIGSNGQGSYSYLVTQAVGSNYKIRISVD